MKSKWCPPLHLIPIEVDRRLDSFFKGVKAAFKKKKSTSNLLPFQETLLRSLRRDKSIIIVNSDKGLGPCAVDREKYISDALIHLNDKTAYQLLTADEAKLAAAEIKHAINQWTIKFRPFISDMSVKYIRNSINENKDPFGFFYLLYKLHKNPISTRPVCSDCGSLLHSLGKWVMLQLQPVAKKMPSYFKDTFALLKLLKNLPPLPPNASFFTCDAKSMYTNIDTDAALDVINDYLRANTKEFSYHAETLIAAMDLVFRNNILSFGDAFLRQLTGTAMGISPAPPYATIFFGIHELDMLPSWTHRVPFYKRFIDDVLGIWIHHEDPATDRRLFNEFQAEINDFHGLEWDFTPLDNECNFMDVTLTINDDGGITSTLYEKALNLYLYIPPHSAHSPGVLAGLVMGNVLRMFQLCSHQADCQIKIQEFYRRLLKRGYKPSTLLPMFTKAIENARAHQARNDTEQTAIKSARVSAAERQAYFHLLYHPDNPPAHQLQSLWRDRVATPVGAPPFNLLHNHEGENIPVDQLILAYHRAPNLGNWFTYRKITEHSGPNVSSRLERD